MSTFVPENTETCVRIGFTLKKEETKLTRTFAQMPFVPSDETLKKERCEQILSIQAQGLKKTLRAYGGENGGDRRFRRSGFNPCPFGDGAGI